MWQTTLGIVVAVAVLALLTQQILDFTAKKKATPHIGSIFVYGLSVIDAYKTARIHWETWKYAQKYKTE